MNECLKNGCQFLQTRCATCGRLVCERILPKHEWISVIDRLPPQDGSEFLGYDPNEESRIYVLRYKKRARKFDSHYKCIEYGYVYEEASGECWFTWEPTHWMPLPEVPN